MCTWMNDHSKDTFDWSIGSGETTSYLTGPDVDHTTGTAGGKLKLYLELQTFLSGILFMTFKCFHSIFGADVDILMQF